MPPGGRRGRRPWRRPTLYQGYLGGALIGAVGSWMLRTAQILLVIEVTGANGLLVGIVTAAQYVPTLVLSGYVGVRADRQSKGTLLMIGQLVMIGAALAQAALLFYGVDSWVFIAILATLFGVGTAIDGPMRTSVLPDLVPTPRVPAAVSVNVVLLQLGRFVGPPLTAYLVLEVSFAWAFTIAGLGLIGFAAVLPRVSVPPKPTDSDSGGLRAALVYLRRRPRMLAAFFLAGVTGLVGPNLVPFSALIVYQRFDGGAGEVAVASTSLALGALVGSVWAARTRHRSLGMVAALTITVGLMSAASALMPTPVLFYVLLGVAGCAALAMVSQATARVQEFVDDDMRGRVTGLYFIVLVGGAPIGAPLIGALGDVIGITWAVALAGVVVAATGLLIFLPVRTTLDIAPVHRD
ncbi:MFS transporter [Microbacterium sp.]|uniref:MFS transporter n=1 Tax=Microbacterium sp. TaxID=51671 RepID=UPI003A8A031B